MRFLRRGYGWESSCANRFGEAISSHSWSENRHAGWHFVFPDVRRGWISVSLHPDLPQHLPPLHPLQHLCLLLLLMFSSASRLSMEMEDLTYGPQGIMILCRSQLVLWLLLSILGRYMPPLQYSPPPLVHLPSYHRSPFGGKSQANDLKQALLGRQPKHLLAFLLLFFFKKKSMCAFFLSPPSSLRHYWHSPSLGLFPCLFHWGQWKSQAWGVSL